MVYSDFIFWGAIVVLSGIFLYCCWLMISAFKTQSIPIAYAGSIHGPHPSSAKVNAKAIDIIKNQLRENSSNENLIPYLVDGDSMQYADIHNGDIVLTEKPNFLNLELPKVIVLEGINNSDSTLIFKLRRAWKVLPNDTDILTFTEIIKDILVSDKFKELKSLVKHKCPTDSNLLEEIVDKYKHFDNSNREDIVISTTYRTGIQKIGFSLHRTADVVGVVAFIAAKKTA